MPPVKSFRSRIAATAAALGLALLQFGCSGKGSGALPAPKGFIRGTITYTRPPLIFDTNGVPTGLETNPANFRTLPARGLAVRIYQVDNSGPTVRWVLRGRANTDSNGYYIINLPVASGYIVQIESSIQPGANSLNLIADPNGLSSLLPQIERPRYLLRASSDGVPATPANFFPTGSVEANQAHTVNFSIDSATTWMIGSTALNNDASASQFSSALFEGSPSGSRITAILDSAAQFGITYGDPTPGATLDLHYLLGRSEPAGTYIEYRPSQWVLPGGLDLAYDASSDNDHFFGSVRGGGGNDDAYDASVIYRMLGRSFMYRLNSIRSAFAPFPFTILPIGTPIDGLSPDQAMVEGLPFILAANLLNSPYLADTDGTSALVGTPIDIRDLSGVAGGDVGPYSSRTLAAALWEIDLKANGISSPGTSSNWATMNPSSIVRLFNISAPKDPTTGATLFSPVNIYTQIGLLKNTKTAAEPVDLAAIFNDTTLNTITAPFNLPWPQPTTTVFGQTWTIGTVTPPYSYTGTFSMSDDHLVGGVYPNASYKELAYLGVAQSTDQTYQLTLQTTPSALPAGSTIQVVVFSGASTQAYTFTGTSTTPFTFTLAGNGNTTTPAQYPIRVRLLSPTTLQADIPFTLQLNPAPPGTLRGPVLSN